jgi:hypothetical protein
MSHRLSLLLSIPTPVSAHMHSLKGKSQRLCLYFFPSPRLSAHMLYLLKGKVSQGMSLVIYVSTPVSTNMHCLKGKSHKLCFYIFISLRLTSLTYIASRESLTMYAFSLYVSTSVSTHMHS